MVILLAECRQLHTYFSELSSEQDSKNNSKHRLGIVRKLKLGNGGARTNPLEQLGVRAVDRTQSIQSWATEGLDVAPVCNASSR